MDQREDREVDVQRLLDELCVTLGFCLPPDDEQRLRTLPPADADAFTDAVFEAEGLDPRLHKQLRRRVRDRVDRHMRRWQGAGGPGGEQR